MVLDARLCALKVIETRIDKEGHTADLIHAAAVLHAELRPVIEEVQRVARGWAYLEPHLG
jgi:hypothetical protein